VKYAQVHFMRAYSVAHRTVVGKLGNGGMGLVYKAEVTTLHRLIALEFLSDGFASDQQALHRFTVRTAPPPRSIMATSAPSIRSANTKTSPSSPCWTSDELCSSIEFRNGLEMGPRRFCLAFQAFSF